MLSINTYVPALYAQLALKNHTQEINRLAKIQLDAKNTDLDNISASVVPTYLTTTIRGTTQALSNTAKARDLFSNEYNTLDQIVKALTTMKDYAEAIQSNSPAADRSQFDAAQSSISTYIAANSYNSRDLSAGGNIGVQVGVNPNQKISFTLPQITLSAVEAPNFAEGDSSFNDTTAWNTINDALTAVNRDKDSVTATIARIDIVSSWLDTDRIRSEDYRRTLLDQAVKLAITQSAAQEELKKVAETILEKSNASNQGIIDLIASAMVPVH